MHFFRAFDFSRDDDDDDDDNDDDDDGFRIDEFIMGSDFSN